MQNPANTVYSSPLGDILLSADDSGLTGLCFRDGTSEITETENPVFTPARHWLDLYFAGKKPDWEVPLHISGTAFQKEVWNHLRSIPYGTTVSYGEIAKILAEKHGLRKMSPQAVGGAAGRNPVLLLIPCHRVTGTNGRLTGYAGGLERKHYLLELEAYACGKKKTPLR